MVESLNFGKILKELRQKSGLTQKQLAAQMGVTKSLISFYELQERVPSPSVLVKLSTIFHVSTDYLLGIDTTKRLDVSDLDEDDIKVISLMIDTLRRKNKR
mgnify:CR=1 FL=1|jgi:transcriptional regulator with XRE-family HTH domain